MSTEPVSGESPHGPSSSGRNCADNLASPKNAGSGPSEAPGEPALSQSRELGKVMELMLMGSV